MSVAFTSQLSQGAATSQFFNTGGLLTAAATPSASTPFLTSTFAISPQSPYFGIFGITGKTVSGYSLMTTAVFTNGGSIISTQSFYYGNAAGLVAAVPGAVCSPTTGAFNIQIVDPVTPGVAEINFSNGFSTHWSSLADSVKMNTYILAIDGGASNESFFHGIFQQPWSS